MKHLLVVGTLLIAASGTLGGQTKQLPEERCCCTTYDTGQCLIKVRKEVENELDDTYKKALVGRPESDVRTSLEKAQEAWVAYRQANCDAEYATYKGGSMASNMSAICEIRLTRQRIQELNYIYLPEH